MPATSTPSPSFKKPPFVPQALLDLPQWVCHQADKVPICAGTGTSTGFTRLEMGRPYDEAVAATQRLNLAGVGFVFHAKNHLIGIDLDDCRNPITGEIEPWAQAVLDLAETYAEVSPSGTGVHLFARGDLGVTAITSTQVEMYASGRYFTVTGQHIEGTPLDVNPAPLTVQMLKDRIGTAGAKIANLAPGVIPEALALPEAEALALCDEIETLIRNKNIGREDWIGIVYGFYNASGQNDDVKPIVDRFTDKWEDGPVHPDKDDVAVWDRRNGETKAGLTTLIRWLERQGTPEATVMVERIHQIQAKTKFEAVDNSGDSPDPAADEWVEPSLDLFDELARLGGVHPKKEIILPGFERGFVSLVAGPTGAMKSLWMLQVALAIVAGQAAADKMMNMGKIDYCGNVAIYPYEDAISQIGKRVDAMIRVHKLGDPKKFPYRIKLREGQIFKWKNAEELRLDGGEMRELMALPELAMIVIDTLTAALLSDETNREFQQVMNLGKLLAAKTGAVVVIVHHYRKGTSKDDEASSMENIRGGSSLTGAARNVLLIEPPSKKEEADHGLDGCMKRIHRKNSNGPLDVVRWFEREVTDVNVVDKRDGARSTETAPALVPFTPSSTVTMSAKLQEALARIVAAEARLGRRVQIVVRNDGQADIAQTVLGLETRETKKVLAELERYGKIKRTPATDSQRKAIMTVEVCADKVLDEKVCADSADK